MKLTLSCIGIILSLALNTAYAAEATAAKSDNDGKIVEILIVLNNNEISAAEAALKKADNKLDIEYAHMMKKDHTENLDQTLKISHEIHQAPVASDTSEKMKEEGKQSLDALSGLDKSALDKEYMNAMVKGHQDALKLIDDQLQVVQNAKLKSHLEATRTHVNHHLEKALEDQKEIH